MLNVDSMSVGPVPRVVAWEATRACRFACIHCRADAQTKPDPKQLTTDEAFRLVDEMADFANPLLIITGGDPLLRQDVFQVVQRAANKGLRVAMSPSGSEITPEVVQKMKDSGIGRVSISIDGSNASIHDGFRMVQGAFDLALSSIHHIKNGGLPFQINTTVTEHNIHDLPNIKELAVRLGAVSWDVFMLVPTGRAKVRMETTPEQYENVLYSVYEWNQSSPIPIKMTCAPHYMRIIAQREGKQKGRDQAGAEARHEGGAVIKPPSLSFGRLPSSRLGGRGCMAGNGFCFISHIGKVYGCGFLPLKAGDIHLQKFKEIYQQSPLFQALRNYDLLTGRCGVCEYRSICGGCRARAFGTEGNYLGEEPYCTYRPAIK